jgi:hypothetical protein
MSHSLFTSFGADAHQRSVSLRHLTGFPASFGPCSTSIWEGSHQRVRQGSRQLECELRAAKPMLIFALQITVGGAAAIGTILALFAWSGAGL